MQKYICVCKYCGAEIERDIPCRPEFSCFSCKRINQKAYELKRKQEKENKKE